MEGITYMNLGTNDKLPKLNTHYSSLSKRLMASFFDNVIISALSYLLSIIIFIIMTIFSFRYLDEFINHIYLIYFSLHFLVAFFYYITMESSSFQGTLGKLIADIKVVKLNGDKLSIFQAFCRFFIANILLYPAYFFYALVLYNVSNQIIINHSCNPYKINSFYFYGLISSSLIYLIYKLVMLITILISNKKQGIHDILIKTLVIIR
ncbi:hypothetical protein NL50_07165 [Clostridium acetobutylicum]|nr:hypothetical protein NL50_07165 [Clostridium acetobutylicum]